MLRGTNVHDAIEEFYVLARPVYRKAYEALKKGHREEALQMLLDCVPPRMNRTRWVKNPLFANASNGT